MGWWKEKRYRMIQNNLRDVDACMDIDRYVETLTEFGANVCMVGCGGITAFYPTKLECQRISSYLRGDFFGRLLKRCHDNGIRVIARFDFSKTHEEFLERHPEWYSRTLDGGYVRYHDTVATCVNAPYQQELSLKILEEVITNYDVDGVFFNMFGYQTRDYNNHYIGICQCESCRYRFREYSGMMLPKQENEEDPVFRKYQEFKKYSTEKLLGKIYKKVKELNPNVAVCTYSCKGVDLVRNESNSAVDRPLPFWNMASEENVSYIRGTFNDVFSSNCCINAVDIFYRFMGVSPQLNELRLYGAMASGGNLDWCIIGGFETYPDRKNFDGTKRVFAFHQKYENLFNQMQSCADILLIRPYDGTDALREYLGIFRMLKESHLLFDVIDGREEEIFGEKASSYRAVILPGVKSLKETTAKALRESRAILVGTGLTLKNDPQILKELFGVSLRERLDQVRGSYILTEPKDVFSHFIDRDWVYLDKEYIFMEPENGNKNYSPLVSASMYGPPERCFGHAVTEQSCVSIREGKSVYFPWMPGNLYYSQGYEDHKNIFLDVFRQDVLPVEKVEVKAPPCVEIFFDRCGEEQYLLQLINYSGFNGMTFYEPLPIQVEAMFPGIEVAQMHYLDMEGKRKIGKGAKITLKGLYQAVLVTGKEKQYGALV